MRITTPILLGAFMLIGLLPHAGAQPLPANVGTRTAAGAASPGQRDTYIRKSEEELDEWQAKLFRFDEATNARAHKDVAASWTELLADLEKAEAGAYKLQTVARDGLEDAKVSYEKATSELADAWGRVRPEDRREQTTGD
jgi:small-conductance mechanosensitive channel